MVSISSSDFFHDMTAESGEGTLALRVWEDVQLMGGGFDDGISRALWLSACLAVVWPGLVWCPSCLASAFGQNRQPCSLESVSRSVPAFSCPCSSGAARDAIGQPPGRMRL